MQLLLTGMQILGEDAGLSIPDRELASLRRVRHLEVVCEHVLPKRLLDIRRLTAELDRRRRRPLAGRDFERTVLTLVFATQTLGWVAEHQQQEVWAKAVIRLFTALQRDLEVLWRSAGEVMMSRPATWKGQPLLPAKSNNNDICR